MKVQQTREKAEVTLCIVMVHEMCI